MIGLMLMVIWGANFSIQKHVFASLTVSGFLFLRALVLALCAAAMLLMQHGLKWPRIPRAQWGLLALAGLLGQFLHIATATYGIGLSTAFSSSLILACGPIFTLIWLSVLGVERLRPRQVMGVLLACAGILIFSSEKITRNEWTAGGGDLMLLMAAALFALYVVLSKPLMAQHGASVVVCYSILIGSVPMLALEHAALMKVQWAAPPFGVWLGFFWCGVIVSFLGWIVWGWVNGVRGVAQSAPLLYLMPPVAGVISWVAGGEGFSTAKLAGAGIALAGVAVAQLSSVREPDDSTAGTV